VEKEEFERYLWRSGRLPSAVKHCVGFVSSYEEFPQNSRRDTNLEDAGPEDFNKFIRSFEKETGSKSKS